MKSLFQGAMHTAYFPLISILGLITLVLATGCTRAEEELTMTPPAGYAPAQAIQRESWKEKAMAYANAPTESVLFEDPNAPVAAPVAAAPQIKTAKTVLAKSKSGKRMKIAKARARKRNRLVAGRPRFAGAKAMNVALTR